MTGEVIARRVRVLVADDDDNVRSALEQLIDGSPGFEVIGCAAETNEAIALAATHYPDVAVLDISMPGGGGLRAAAEICQLSPDTKIVALSARSDSGSKSAMGAAGAVRYVVKGDDVDLLDVICEVMSSSDTGS